MSEPEKKPTIDERLEALTMNLELQAKEGEKLDRRIAELTAASERHEREIERFRRAMRAALQAWLEEGDDGHNQQQ